MRLWGRAKVVRSGMFCLWLTLLGFALVMLALSDLFNRDRTHQSSRLPSRPRIPRAGDLEVIVESRDPALELVVDFAQLNSLQDDQLLLVPSTQGTKSPPQKRGSYKMVLPGVSQVAAAPAPPTHAATGQAALEHLRGLDGEREQAAVEKYGFNEEVSEKLPLRRTLPEARHPR